MLSAVAARKARLQVGNAQAVQSEAITAPSHSDTPATSKPSSKRKTSSHVAKPGQKKRRVKSMKAVPARYFQSTQESWSSAMDDPSDEDSSSEEGSHRPIARGFNSQEFAHMSDADDLESAETSLHGSLHPNGQTASSAILSTWRPLSGQNMFTLTAETIERFKQPTECSATAIVLVVGEQLALLGTYTVTVLHGAVSLAGTQLTPATGSHRVFAPRSSPIPIIHAVQSESRHSASNLDFCQQFLNDTHAIIMIQELRTGVEGLGRICRNYEGVFEPARLSRSRHAGDIGLKGVHYVDTHTPELQAFSLSASWEKALRSALAASSDEPKQIHLVQGAKKSGKSSFARTLMNNLVLKHRAVAFLECDLGQSEFTPAGMVSLNIVSNPMFGPPFTHPSVPYRAHFIGDSSPANSPSLYIDAIKDLMQTYEADILYRQDEVNGGEDVVFVPLVVNTMGWTKGLGVNLLHSIRNVVQPTHTYHFDSMSNGPTLSEDSILPYAVAEAEPAHNEHHVLQPASPTLVARYTPADNRALAIMSYFHAVFPHTPDQVGGSPTSTYACSWDTSLPLCAQIPYELDANAPFVESIILTGPSSEDIVLGELHRVLNGAVVALVGTDSDSHHKSQQGLHTAPLYSQGTPVPVPQRSACMGLALVRSLAVQQVSGSVSALKLHILTPYPLSTRQNPRRCDLVKGTIELPIWGFLDFRAEDKIAGFDKTHIPFLRWGKGEGAGNERRRIRRNLMRYGQK